MDEAEESAFDRWFSALEAVPNGGREITAVFDSLSDNAILDLVREAAALPEAVVWTWISSSTS